MSTLLKIIAIVFAVAGCLISINNWHTQETAKLDQTRNKIILCQTNSSQCDSKMKKELQEFLKQ